MTTTTETESSVKVYQSFETLGSPCTTTVDAENAQDVAEVFRESIADMVSEWEVSEPSEAGYAKEIAAWNRANEIAGDSPTYGRKAAEYIADQAVVVEEN